MKKVSAVELVRKLERAKIPVVLIGAKAVNVLGSSRLSADMDWGARILDADKIIDLMYAQGYLIPTKVLSGDRILWAKTADHAKAHVEREKSGALNFYLVDADGQAIDQIDFVFENPIPFAVLKRDANIICKNPKLASASVDHLIAMKEKRIADGKGKMTDEVDLAFLRELKQKKKKKSR